MSKLIPGICTQCGANLSVDQNMDAMICPYCNTPFIVEKAIQNFNTTYTTINNITAQNVFVAGNINNDFEISGGILNKYNGSSLDIVIPDNVVRIGKKVFFDMAIRSVFMSNNVTFIDNEAFAGCTNLEKLTLSQNLEQIGGDVFNGNFKLDLFLPDSLYNITSGVGNFCDFCKSVHLSSIVLSRFNRMELGAKEIYLDNKKLTVDDFINNPILGEKLYNTKLAGEYRNIKRKEGQAQQQQQQESWKKAGRCQFCGGTFKGFFTPICSKCGMKKNY